MFETNAIFSRKEPQFETEPCVINTVIQLSGSEYDEFSRNMNADQDFIKDNQDLMGYEDGVRHCLLVVSDERRDGILIHSSGYDYARYAAFVPNAEGLLTVGRYPALADLNKKLTNLVEIIAEHVGADSPDGRGVINLQDWEEVLDFDLMTNGALRSTVLNMLCEKPEIADWELDKNELIIYRNTDSLVKAAGVYNDPAITKTDMYSFEGMIPLGKEAALEIIDKNGEVYLLYPDDTESAATTREEVESFDGMFGFEDSSWQEPVRTVPVEVFIMNREKYEHGEASGEWLKLPTNADALQNLLERIGVDRPSEGAFSITAVRVQYEVMKEYVSKYDSLDELNMLATYMHDMEDYEHGIFQAALTSGVVDVGSGTAALINLLDADNMYAFDITDANDAKALGEYWQDDKPEGISIEDYGKEIVESEKGKFTEWGYISFKYDKLLPEYNGIVPDEYKIVGPALHDLRSKAQEHNSAKEKPSVLEQLREARQNPRPPKEPDAPGKKKNKGGPEL